MFWLQHTFFAGQRRGLTAVLFTISALMVGLISSCSGTDTAVAMPIQSDVLDGTEEAIEHESAAIPYTYCPAPGESAASIAADAGISEEELRIFNGFAPTGSIPLGQALQLPLGSIPPHEWTSSLPAGLSVETQMAVGASGIFLGTDNRSRRIGMTFDIGHNPRNVEMLEYLASRGVRATVFLVGASPEMIDAILDNGHELANHSWTHGDLTTMEETAVYEEFMRAERIIQRRGATTRPWFRAPFGALDDTVRRIADEEGFNLVGWTVDSGDWLDDISTEQIVERMTSGLCPGAITIMHGSRDYNRAALPQIIDFIEAQGYETVPLSELVSIEE